MGLICAGEKSIEMQIKTKKVRLIDLFSTLLLTVLILVPAYVNAQEPKFFTVQTGSFREANPAITEYYALAKELKGKALDNLRIERIGAYYAVRIGRFKDQATAEEFINTNSTQLSQAIVLSATIKEERIVRNYKVNILSKDSKTPVLIVTGSDSREAKGLQPLPATPIDNKQQAPAGTLNALPPKKVEATIEQVIIAQADQPLENQDTKVKTNGNEQTGKKLKEAKQKTSSNIRGRFYVSDYYSADSGNFDFHVLTSRLKLYKPEDKKPGYYFKLDGRARIKISDRDVHKDLPEYKLYEFWMGYLFNDGKLNIIGGRQFINELYNTSIDGLNVKYTFWEGLGLGLFGGLAPDKYDYSFTSNFRSFGAYGYVNRDNYNMSVGYENLNFKGETDREYISLKSYVEFNKQVRVNLISSASINQITKDVDIENINANLTYNYSRDLRFNVFYNYYRAIRYFESSKQFFDRIDLAENYFLDTNSQTRTGMRVDYKIMKGLKIYASAAYQKRKIDNKDATRFMGGINKYDLFGFDLSGRYTYIDNYTSKSSEFNVEASRNLFDSLELSLYASREEEKLDIENGFTTGVLTYGGSLYWMINKHYFASMFIERYDEDDYYNTSVFTQLGYRF